MASGFNTLQQESGGRMSLGIGRGDSSLAHIGKNAAPLSALETFLVRLQRYLRGEVVDRDGFASRLVTHAPDQPKVPVDIAGTGPRVIAMAARHAEGLTLGVGANPERIAAKVRETEAGLAAAGRSREGFTISAYVNVGVDDRIDVARELVRGGASVTARFSGMHGGAGSDGLAPQERNAVLALAERYDMAHHGSSAAPHARALPDEFLDGFAAIGDVARVTERLRAIAATGVDRVVMIAGSLGVDMELIQRSLLALSTEGAAEAALAVGRSAVGKRRPPYLRPAPGAGVCPPYAVRRCDLTRPRCAPACRTAPPFRLPIVGLIVGQHVVLTPDGGHDEVDPQVHIVHGDSVADPVCCWRSPRLAARRYPPPRCPSQRRAEGPFQPRGSTSLSSPSPRPGTPPRSHS